MTTSLAVLTVVHVIISLVGIGSGVVVIYQLIAQKQHEGWTLTFLASTVLTSATGFLFPFQRVLPSHVLGVLSLLVLAAAIVGRYGYRGVGAWGETYVLGSVVALYFNMFVLVAQLFLKVPALRALAPTQSEPLFAVAQLLLFAVFVALGVVAFRRNRIHKLHVVL